MSWNNIDARKRTLRERIRSSSSSHRYGQMMKSPAEFSYTLRQLPIWAINKRVKIWSSSYTKPIAARININNLRVNLNIQCKNRTFSFLRCCRRRQSISFFLSTLLYWKLDKRSSRPTVGCHWLSVRRLLWISCVRRYDCRDLGLIAF